MDGAEAEEFEVPQGQQILKAKDDGLTHLLNTNKVKDGILKYLDGSALINLSGVNKQIRNIVTSSKQFNNSINLRVTTKAIDIFTTGEQLPGWTENLANLTLICNSEFVFVSSEKFSSLTRTLPNLSSLEIINESKSASYLATFVNKILQGLSSKLKSLSLPYDLLLNLLTFDHGISSELQELKFTTSNYEFNIDRKFLQNLNFFASNCTNLKSFACQELTKVEGRYVIEYNEYCHEDFNGVLQIIQRNSEGLEKLEFGISQLLANPELASLTNIIFPNLKFLDLRAVKPKSLVGYPPPPVIEILNNLSQPWELTTLKLTLTVFPLELFDLIPQNFIQLKSLSLKASRFSYSSADGQRLNENSWSFLHLLAELEELEITRFVIFESTSDFGVEISDSFLYLLGKNKLRKLSLKGFDNLNGSTFFNEIAQMPNLKELALNGCSMFLVDFMTICTNLNQLEKLDISYFYPSDAHEENRGWKYTNCQILNVFSSLKYLKELSIEFWNDDFSKVLRFISFPYLRSLTLSDANLNNGELENIIRLNPMLKGLNIASFIEESIAEDSQDENLEIHNERNNLKIEYFLKQLENDSKEEVREDSDPDSRPLNEQLINWLP